MNIQREALTEALASLIEAVGTRHEMLIHLEALGVDVSDGNVQGDGKSKYTKSKLHATSDEVLLEIAKRALSRFSGTQKATEQFESLRILVSPASLSTLFFAGHGKPDVIFTDFTRGKYTVRDAKGCLVVSLPDDQTVTWQQVWDQQKRRFTSHNGLYEYLINAIPEKSPQAREMFEIYCYSTLLLGKMTTPAILPELNLHYDTLTLKQRGGLKALESQRCDFYMRVGSKEILLEVDGIGHYVVANGVDKREGYGEQCRWDRERTLLGYEIYRFGTAEFDGRDKEDRIKGFFNLLAEKYNFDLSF
ncbi:hypothetical protein [Deinococcus yunweiensis]|uniref:hypothetical protein n=1 Tax=Deinococcus yunweiensis TaxID=367282 RepID=UPI00398F3236